MHDFMLLQQKYNNIWIWKSPNGSTDVKDYKSLEGKSQLKSCLLLKVIILIFFFKLGLP